MERNQYYFILMMITNSIFIRKSNEKILISINIMDKWINKFIQNIIKGQEEIPNIENVSVEFTKRKVNNFEMEYDSNKQKLRIGNGIIRERYRKYKKQKTDKHRYELIDSLLTDYYFKSILIHEIIHILDINNKTNKTDIHYCIDEKWVRIYNKLSLKIFEKLKTKLNKGKLNKEQTDYLYEYRLKLLDDKVYANNELELNARFFECVFFIIDKEYQSFHDCLLDFKSKYEFWNFLSNKNKRKTINRLYTFYHDIKHL